MSRSPQARLGVWAAAALVVSHTIAVGIFLTPAELIGALASPALTLGLWLVGALAVLAGAVTFGELATRYPRAGGLYVYLREAWGPRVAFLYGWQALLVMDPGVTAALAAGGAGYVPVVWRAAAGHETVVAVGIIAALAALNALGLKIGARVFGVLTVLKLCTLAAIIGGAMLSGGGSWDHFVPFAGARPGSAPPLGPALAVGLVSVFFSFGGFWETSRIAAEIEDPRRGVPRALIGGVAAVTVVYLMTTIAFMYLVPAHAATDAAGFARMAGEALAGSAGPPLLAGAVLVSVVASAMAMIMVAPRLYEAMSRDGMFFAAFATRNATGTPLASTLLLAVLSTVFVLVGRFDQIVSFFVATALFFLGLAAAALFVIRRRDSVAAPALFHAPGYPLTPAVFIALVTAVVLMVAMNRPVEALSGFAIVAAGLAAYGRFSRRRSMLEVNP